MLRSGSGGRVLRGLLTGLLVVGSVVGLLVAGRVGWVAYGPVDEGDRVDGSVTFLYAAIANGAPDRMQALFPEGSYFLRALAASSDARSATPDLTAARALRDSLDSTDSVAVFGAGMRPEHGIFQAGWALGVAVDVARASETDADRVDVDRRGRVIAEALRSSRSGFLEGYPRQYWPCDTVVAVAALVEAAGLLDRPDWVELVRTWRTRIQPSLDPRLQLLPHRVDKWGHALEEPRGSSQSIIQANWPIIADVLDGHPDLVGWGTFREAFVVRRAGLVGVREYPRGATEVEQSGAGDVDSGPLVLGVSASASAVTLAAARRVGDTRLAADLSREAELFGLPLAWGGQRRYALGVLPVGDAFLAWARSRPLGADLGRTAEERAIGRPLWPVAIVVGLLPSFGLLFVVGLRRRSRRGPTRDGAGGDWQRA